LTRQDDKARLRKRLVDQAIAMTTTNKWEEAVVVNRRVLETGEDPETFNRLGKALMELGRYQEAHDAYQQALQLMPTNTIARRNLARLEPLLTAGAVDATPVREQVDLRLFISETGKTCITTLVDVASPDILARLTSGDKLDLRVTSTLIEVITPEGIVIGKLEPRLSTRLREMTEGGNRYAIAVAHTEGTSVKVLIREIFQAPTQRNKLSFPGKLSGDLASFRPYIREFGRYDYDADELLDDDDMAEEEVEESFGGDEEEVGLEEVESDISDDDEMPEE
jgi:tetratricopeptide (TPR) repeat protein